MTITIKDLGDIAGKYDISIEEANRIIETVADVRGFEAVWDNEDWWKDGNCHSDVCETRYKESGSYV